MSICVWNKSRGEVSVWVTSNSTNNGSKSWWTLPPGSWDNWKREGSETVTVYRHGLGSTNYEKLVGYPGSNAIIEDPPTPNMKDITVRNDNYTASIWVRVTNDTNPFDQSRFVELPKQTERKWMRAGPEVVFVMEPSRPDLSIQTAENMQVSTWMGVPGGATIVNRRVDQMISAGAGPNPYDDRPHTLSPLPEYQANQTIPGGAYPP